MEVRNIEINKINQLENVRVKRDEKDLSFLMNSIKNDGLLEPVGVSHNNNGSYDLIYGNRRFDACKKLGWYDIPAVILEKSGLKDAYIKNTVENIQREDVSPTEQGRVFMILKDKFNMSNSELASRFSIPKHKVDLCLSLFKGIPSEYRDKISFIPQGVKKKGLIPASTAEQILRAKKLFSSKINKQNINKLLDAASHDKFTTDHVRIISQLLEMGYSIDESISLSKEYSIVTVHIPFKTNEIDAITKKLKLSKVKLFVKILRGDLKICLPIPEWK